MLESGLRSEGKALVIELDGPASAPAFRRRTKRKPPTRPGSTRTPPAIYGQLSITSSMKLDGGGGGGFFAAVVVGALGGAGFGSAAFGGSAGLGASAGFAGSTGFTSATFGGSALGGSGLGGSALGATALGGSAFGGPPLGGPASGGTAGAARARGWPPGLRPAASSSRT